MIDSYNHTVHRTTGVTPVEALAASTRPNMTPEQVIRAADMRQRIRNNIARAGEANLARVQKERSRKLPPIAAGQNVLFSAEKPRKLHSASVGMYVYSS